VTRAYLTERLYAYRDECGAVVCGNTLRRVHSAWSVFFDYLTEREIFEASPMATVKPPTEQRRPVESYELDIVKRLVAGAPTPELRGALALAYGAAVERGALLTLRREQICEAALEVRAIGTKAHQRNRAVQLDRWALPFVAELLRDKTPTAYLLPDDWREDDGEGLSRAHDRLVAGLELTPRLTLRHARHHWAATHLRAGVPVPVVQRQLGHSTPVLTLQTYAAFIPQGQDRAHWAQVVEQDQERRKIAGL
jgi:integrase